jgi:hypothetical protein
MPLSREARLRYPLHPAVAREFVGGSADIRLQPAGLDVKQAEFVRCLLVDGRRTVFAESGIPVFVSTDKNLEAMFVANKPPVSVIVDFHDKGRRFDFIDITDPMWAAIEAGRLQVIYLKLQIHDPAGYAPINKLPSNVHILSCPLLLGGSRFHITIQDDFDGDALFRRTLVGDPPPPPEYDWSFVGSPTSDDRAAAFEVLRDYTARRRFFTISEPGHASASVATVPMPEMLRISRASKVCLSLNGRGPWCLKDGELFAAGCMVLRQAHPVLTLNPLTPKAGVHWAVADTADLPEAIESLLADDARRESIRRAGHGMFADVLLRNAWSTVYVDRLVAFLQSQSKAAWGKFAVA